MTDQPNNGEWRPDDPLPAITRIELRTPFKVGPVNCYVVDDEPLTLLDCGPLTDDAWADLNEGLAKLGRRPEQVQRIILTHGHVDHWGLAARIVGLSGADLWIHPRIAAWIQDFPAEWERRLGYLSLLFTELGVPAGELLAINKASKVMVGYAESVAHTRLLQAGDVITLAGRDWKVYYTPGHATGHLSLHQPETRSLVAGDHLLADISSNPVLEAPLLGESARPRMLPLYLESLRACYELPVLWVYPGHGQPFVGHRKLISSRLKGHERRAEQVRAFLASGPTDAFAISRRLFPRLLGIDLFLALSETLGHLDLLEDREQVAQVRGGRPILYRNVL